MFNNVNKIVVLQQKLINFKILINDLNNKRLSTLNT